MKNNTIKIKLRPTQIPFAAIAIEKFLVKCPMRFSSPKIVNGSLRIDPHDFLELTHYMDVNIENELEAKRLKKMFIDSLPAGVRSSDILFKNF